MPWQPYHDVGNVRGMHGAYPGVADMWRQLAEDLQDRYREYCADLAEDGRAGDILTFEDWEAGESERAYERQCEAYYGGNTPQTDRERIEVERRDNPK
jgi:hypothetical protein